VGGSANSGKLTYPMLPSLGFGIGCLSMVEEELLLEQNFKD
jgi:hypothetical protein